MKGVVGAIVFFYLYWLFFMEASEYKKCSQQHFLCETLGNLVVG